MNGFRFWERVRSSLWFVPALFVAGAIGLAVLLANLEEPFGGTSWFRFPGGDDSARSMLSTIAGAMITFTGLVFSITVLVLQLASQQFSPRVLRTFLRDRTSQVSLGIFVATFTYAVAVLWRVQPGSIPALSIGAAVLLVLASVGVFVNYINHIANAIRVSSIVLRVAEEARSTLHDRYEGERQERQGRSDAGADAPVRQVVPAPRPGLIQSLDAEELVEIARAAGAVLEMRFGIGDFVPWGRELVAVRGGELDDGAQAKVRRAISIGDERTATDDLAFGFRQLVDVAEKALSPSLHDPTTAVQVIDHVHDLLRRLATAPFPDRRRRDEDGDVRLITVEPAWEDFVVLSTTEIRRAGRDKIQVLRRLRAMLEDVLDVAPRERRPPVERELSLIADAVRELEPPEDRSLATAADVQGLGGGT